MSNLPEEFKKIGIEPKGKPGTDKGGTITLVLLVGFVLVMLGIVLN